ncbi:squalene synthase HpnC [Ramlibacter sp.]|uniref:squalene synthase HpnC n=1 Tax=Ramlibacter sp. TaxID=1917967 RepID=UPI0017ABFC65|nr:squalene synthase HpnC [Ramlibacter sp.]MBA2674329.1 squalene synthase HpnC [Ramlibacter sp.]
MTTPPDGRPQPVDHYENFPVASWLCPARLRPAVAAIYWFARTADDIADEGDATPAQRLADLAAYESALRSCIAGTDAFARWPQVFTPLDRVLRDFALPSGPLFDLLSAFTQDVRKTAAGALYRDRVELIDYCRRSADPVGRLMLHLYGVTDAQALQRSDAICSALQLINFWQDLSLDIPRGRYYLPVDDLRRHGMDPADPAQWASHPQAPALVAHEVAWARDLMHAGAPLVHQVPGRAGWELRLVVQGGLRILDRIAATGYGSFHVRPKLRRRDLGAMAWRGLRM